MIIIILAYTLYVSWTGWIGNFTMKLRRFVQISSIRKRSIHLSALMERTDKNLYLFSLRLSLKIKELRIGVETIDVKIWNLNLRVLKSRKYFFGGFAFFVAFTITLNDVLFHPGSFSLQKPHVDLFNNVNTRRPHWRVFSIKVFPNCTYRRLSISQLPWPILIPRLVGNFYCNLLKARD